VRELAERAYFMTCLALGRALRAGRYATTRTVRRAGELEVRKRRAFHAPLVVWLGGALFRLLDTGVRVLRQREWEGRERLLYGSLHGMAIRIDPDGTLVLPFLAGRTLATLLEDREVEESVRTRAIELAVVALAHLHRAGFTHGDAMAENVMVDLDTGIARWFDFETVHDANRAVAWRRTDDVRALLATCLLRTEAARRATTLRRIVDVYAGAEVTGLLATSFTPVLRRPLTFHLGQAALSLSSYREIARLLAVPS
jgi:serine/threonine protein kinase